MLKFSTLLFNFSNVKVGEYSDDSVTCSVGSFILILRFDFQMLGDGSDLEPLCIHVVVNKDV